MTTNQIPDWLNVKKQEPIPDWINVKKQEPKGTVKVVRKTKTPKPIPQGGGTIKTVKQPATVITPQKPDLAGVRKTVQQNTDGMPDWIRPNQVPSWIGVQQRGGQPQQPIKRLDPLTATPENPLVTSGQMPDSFKKPAVSDNEMLENILFKKAKKQALTDDEIRFEIKQNMQRMQAPQPGMPVTQPSGAPQQMQPMSMQPSMAPQAPGMQYPMQQTGYMQPYGQPAFSLEDYMNASPDQMLQMQMAGWNQSGQMQKDLLNQQFAAGDQVMGNRIQRAEDRLATEEANMTRQNKELLDQFRADQRPQVEQAIADVTAAGDETSQELKTMQALRGFGRSSKTAELLEKVGTQTQRQVAAIESEANRAVNEYQISLLDKMNTRLDQLQQRVDQAYDQKDAHELEKVKAQSQLMVDLFKQNPMNPQNMMETANKLKMIQIEEDKAAAEQANKDREFEFEVMKWSTEEQRAAQKAVNDSVQWAISTYGSQYFEGMDQAQLDTLASNMGLAPGMLQKGIKTIQEQDKDWEKFKYTNDFNWGVEKFNREQNQELYILEDTQNFQENQQIRAQQGDIYKMLAQAEIDVQKDRQKFAGLSAYSQNASGSNGQGYEYPRPIAHPLANTTVIDINPKVIQGGVGEAKPNGYRYNAGPDSLIGECAWYGQQITTLNGKNWTIGSTIDEKKNRFNGYVKNGQAFERGKGQPQVGYTVFTNDSKTYGHIAVINAITADGKLVLTEANYKPKTVTHTRIVDANDPSIFGFLKTEFKPELQVDKKVGNGLMKEAAASMITPPQGVNQDAQALANFVMQNQVGDLKNYSWWNDSPVKQQAWQIIQQSQQPQSSFNWGSALQQLPGMAQAAGQSAAMTNPFGAAMQGIGAAGGAIMNMFGGGQQQAPQQMMEPLQQPQMQQPQMPQYGMPQQMQQPQQWSTPFMQSVAMGGTTLSADDEVAFAQSNPYGYQEYVAAKQAGQQNSLKQQNKDFTQVNQLASRFDNLSKEMRTLDNGVAIINNFDVYTKNPYDDQALIFSFMKVLDPGSVVREGEFATAQKNGSILSSIAANWGNALQGTGMLTPDQRAKMIQTMRNLYNSKKTVYDEQFLKAQQVGQWAGIDPSLYLDYTPQQQNMNDPLGLGFGSMTGSGVSDPLGLGL